MLSHSSSLLRVSISRSWRKMGSWILLLGEMKVSSSALFKSWWLFISPEIRRTIQSASKYMTNSFLVLICIKHSLIKKNEIQSCCQCAVHLCDFKSQLLAIAHRTSWRRQDCHPGRTCQPNRRKRSSRGSFIWQISYGRLSLNGLSSLYTTSVFSPSTCPL